MKEKLVSNYRKTLEKRRDKICAMYERILESYEVSRHRAMEVVADEFKMSVIGVRGILIERGLYEKQSRVKS